MKILQINASYKPAFIYGGPTMSVSKLSEQMTKSGLTIKVFTTSANGASELPVTANKQVIIDGVPVTYFKRLTKDHSHYSPALLTRLWKEVKGFDLVHIHAWWNLVSVLSCWIAIMRGVPVLISPRGTLSGYSFTNRNSFPKRVIHNFLGKSLLNNSHIHVTSERERSAIESIVTPRTISNIPNFVAIPGSIAKLYQKKEKQLKLLFFSRIEEKKGLDILLNALGRVTAPYHLTIAGDGEEAYIERLKAMASVKGISESLSWIGFQGANKFELLQQHDLLILPSHDENFGNVVIESLSMGTAVLITKYVGLADYVAKNDLGWVCELSESDISNHINGISGQNDHLAWVRQHAPALVRDDFNEESLSAKYIKMYTQIISNV